MDEKLVTALVLAMNYVPCIGTLTATHETPDGFIETLTLTRDHAPASDTEKSED